MNRLSDEAVSEPPATALSPTQTRTLLLIVLLSLTVRLVPAFLVHGTEDVWAWRFAAGVRERGENPYLQTYPFNWPPACLTAVSPLIALSRAWGVPYWGLIKLYPIMGDTLIAVVIYLALARSAGSLKRAQWSAGVWALNPVSIGISSVHGNFIAAPLALLVLAACLVHFGRSRWAVPVSALAMGLAVMAKLWPVLFLPLLLIRLTTWRRRALFVLLSSVPSALSIGWLVLWLGWGETYKRFLAYQSIPGWWGFTGLGQVSDNALLAGVASFYARHGGKILLAGLLALYLVLTWRAIGDRGSPDDTDEGFFGGFVLVGLVLLVFAPGFGPQYLVWVLPFALLARDRWVHAFTLLVTALFVVEYGFRPFTGDIGATVREYQEPPFPPLTMNEALNDNILTNLVRLPVWLLLGAWLAVRVLGSHYRATRGDAHARRPPTFSSAQPRGRSTMAAKTPPAVAS